MIVNWKKPLAGLCVLHISKGGKVVKTITFNEGNNEVSKKDWDQLKEQTRVIVAMEQGWLTEVIETVEKEVLKKDGTTEKVKKEVSTIREMNPIKAEKIVADTFDLEVLEKWKAEENRDSVRAAIANQIESIQNYKPKKRSA